MANVTCPSPFGLVPREHWMGTIGLHDYRGPPDTNAVNESRMRNFFQSRSRPQPSAPVQSGRPAPQAAATFHSQLRAEMDDGVTVSELSELEARALCAREGIPFFWREPAAAPA